MAYREWLSTTVVPPVKETTKNPTSTLVDADRYIWYIQGNTTLTPLNSVLQLAFTRDNAVVTADPAGTWAFDDTTILQNAGTSTSNSHGAKNVAIGVADLTFTPTDTTLHPIMWRFGTTNTALGSPVAWNGTQVSQVKFGDDAKFTWKAGVSPYTIAFSLPDGTNIGTYTVSGTDFTITTTGAPLGEIYIDLYDDNGTYITTKAELVTNPYGKVSVTNGPQVNVVGSKTILGTAVTTNGPQVNVAGSKTFTDTLSVTNGSQINPVGGPTLSGTVSASNGPQVNVAGTMTQSGTISVTNGPQVNVTGGMSTIDSLSVKNGAQFNVVGYSQVNGTGKAVTSNGSQVNPLASFTVRTRGGSEVEVDGRLGATFLNVTTDDVPARYLSLYSDANYVIEVLTSQKTINFTTGPLPGQAAVNLKDVEVYESDTMTAEKTGANSFAIHPKEPGIGVILMETVTGEAPTAIFVTVVDEHSDTVLIKNGFGFNFDDHSIIIQRDVLLNNNANGVNVEGSVVFSGDVSVSNGSKAVASKDYHIFLSEGTNVVVDGYKEMTHYQKIDNGTNVNLNGSVVLSSDINISHGSQVVVVDGHRVPTSDGGTVQLFGWKEEAHHEIVVNGSNVQVTTGQISVEQQSLDTHAGATVDVHGQQPADIVVSYRFVTSTFRGIQVEQDDISIENPATITLTGVSVGGTIPDVAMPCLIFSQSMKEGKEFVKGQITEIPEISLDSSIRLGVKLYSCDNTLLNPTTFASAYFTFEDDLLLPANLDPVNSIIDIIASPADLAILMRKRVYVMNLHVVDKQGNPSIVLTRKLRFI